MISFIFDQVNFAVGHTWIGILKQIIHYKTKIIEVVLKIMM